MIYLTTDSMDNGVYFDLRKREPLRRPGGTESFYGLLGNGIAEIRVTVRAWRDSLEVVFGRGELFSFVEESDVRRSLGDVVRELALQ
jgi:hypothetical protein